MPEFFNGICRYQWRVQPHLGAIARGIRDEAASREFLLLGTEYALAYAGAKPLWQEQWWQRDPNDEMVCPFWSNYCYWPCSSCDCRIDNSVSMEIDALFFLQSQSKKSGEGTLAIHIEI